jgi:hypothetical protein
MIKKISENAVKLCCGGNCAELSLQDGYIIIDDDFGGQAKILLAEALEISEATKQLCG